MNEDAKRIIDLKRTSVPLKTYLWYVELPINITNFYEGDVFELNSRITSISNPYHNLETDKEMEGNSFWYYAKSIDIGNITLEITEHEDGRSLEYFTAWRKMISNDDGTFNPPAHYKRNINFYRLDVQRRKMLIDRYEGYFISGISDVTNDYEGNGLLKYTITLTGDNVLHLNNTKETFAMDKETSLLSTAAGAITTGKDFINKVTTARISKRSLAELLI